MELSRKQAELESREKTLNQTSGALLVGTATATATTAETTAVETVAGGVEAGGAVVASGGVALGVEWVEYWDESAGASYFFNTVTQVQ